MLDISSEPYVCKLNEEGILYIKNKLKVFIPYLSNYVNTTQLTLCTLLWSFLIILSGYLARRNKLWLLLSMIALIGHFITDLLDGEMSIYKNDGLQRWNFFMDHLLDFILTISVFIGLLLMYYKRNVSILFPCFIIFCLIIINMVASFLLVTENGLDLGVRISDCFTFNIFHMHFCLILFYILNIIYNKKVKSLWVWFLVILIGSITIHNVYHKQQELRN